MAISSFCVKLIAEGQDSRIYHGEGKYTARVPGNISLNLRKIVENIL